MKGIESHRNETLAVPGDPAHNVRSQQHRRSHYQKVLDDRKRPLRGLWIRNGRYYAQLTVEDPHTGIKQVRRVPLENATTSAQARKALETMQVQRRKGETMVQRRAPTFAAFAEDYLEFHRKAKDSKRASTMETERYAIDRLKEQFGTLHLNKIKLVHVKHFVAARQEAGMKARTVNLEITVLRNVLNHAIDQKLIAALPTENLRPLKSISAERKLTEAPDIEKLCAAAFRPIFANGRLSQPGEKGVPLLNAEQFVDYIRLMCYCGSRLSETLRLRWDDVNWTKRQLTIGSDGLSKNGKPRVVDFNDHLERHLKNMDSRRITDGKLDTLWAAEESARTAWVTVDLQATQEVSSAMLSDVPYGRTQAFDIEAQVDGEWEKIDEGTTIGNKLWLSFTPVKARLFRLNILKASDTPTLAEFQLFAK